jgi:hypothetical protein
MPVGCEELEVLFDICSQILGGVIVMMQMQLNFTQTVACEVGEHVEKLGVVLFAREEEAVPWVVPVCIAVVLCERRVAGSPCFDPIFTLLHGGAAEQGLVVIAHGKHEVTRASHLFSAPLRRQMLQIPSEPGVEILRAKVVDD